jgi:hypothetical protein
MKLSKLIVIINNHIVISPSHRQSFEGVLHSCQLLVLDLRLQDILLVPHRVHTYRVVPNVVGVRLAFVKIS